MAEPPRHAGKEGAPAFKQINVGRVWSMRKERAADGREVLDQRAAALHKQSNCLRFMADVLRQRPA
eukprot:15452530-Alexandrium_andersonii.AAC.1